MLLVSVVNLDYEVMEQDMCNLDLSDLIGRPHTEEFNCWDLCREVLKRTGVVLPDYDFSDKSAIIKQELGNYIKLKKPEPYCLVYFKWPEFDGFHHHAGVILPPRCDRFIHNNRKTGVAIVRLTYLFYQLSRVGFYKIRK